MTDTIVIQEQAIEVIEVFERGPSGPPGPGGIVLTWDGFDYQPVGEKDSLYPKEFRGPVDPADVDGVILNDYDVWVATS